MGVGHSARRGLRPSIARVGLAPTGVRAPPFGTRGEGAAIERSTTFEQRALTAAFRERSAQFGDRRRSSFTHELRVERAQGDDSRFDQHSSELDGLRGRTQLTLPGHPFRLVALAHPGQLFSAR